MDTQQLREELTQYLSEECAVSRAELAPERDIFTTGVVDSIKVLNLIEFCEKQYGIRISPFDVSPDNFDSISKISEFIQHARKIQNA